MMFGTEKLLGMSAYLNSIGGSDSYKLTVDKSTFAKLVEQFQGMIQDENGNFIDPAKLENVKRGKVFMVTIEIE